MLTKIEEAILNNHPDAEIDGRHLRGMLSSRGFRRSAPALVFTIARLADKELVVCREEVRVVDGIELRERYYRLADPR